MGRIVDKQLFNLIHDYFTLYLPNYKSASEHTLRSYRKALDELLEFIKQKYGISLFEVSFDKINRDLLQEFMAYLREEKKCKDSTCNLRLTCIKAFLKYCAESDAALTKYYLSTDGVAVRTIPENNLINYLSEKAVRAIIAQPDIETDIGQRDIFFMILLYDTGARVSEILSLKVRDVHLSTPAKVILYGKGRKLREVPILPNTALHLQQYLTEHKLSAPEKLDRTLFVNRQGNPLTRAGATYILNKYVQMAELDTHVSPHILRHTKAMHLLEAGINIFYIKDLLGHEDISTTEVYAKASIETQRRALEKHSLVMPPATPSWVTNTDTLEWLKALGK